MLNDELLDKLTDRLTNRIEEANTYTLKQIANTINKIGRLSKSDAQRLGQIIKYGGDYDKIVKKLAEMTKLNVKDIKKIFRQLASQEYKVAKQFYDYRKIKYIPFEDNKVLQRQIDAISNITLKEYINLSNTSSLGLGIIDSKTGKPTLKVLKQAYYDAIDEAIMSVSQGKETFDSQMSKIIKEMGKGLKVIYPTTYKDKKGKIRHYTRRLDSAVRMNLKDGLRTLHNEEQELFGKEFDSDGVEISVHENPAIDHEKVQGKQFSTVRPSKKELSEWEKLQAGKVAKDYKGNTYCLDHDNKNGYRPISKINCYHYIFSIILGISEPIYDDKKLKEINERNHDGFTLDGKHYTMYEGTQLQRQLETEIRKQKDIQIMARETNRENVMYEAQDNINKLTNKYRELCNVSGLPSKAKRMAVSNYRRVAKKK